MANQLTLERNLSFLEIIEGETDDLERQVCESSLLAMLKRSGVEIHSIEICTAGCFVIIGSCDVEPLKCAARSLNVAVRVVHECGRVVVRSAADTKVPSLGDVISAFHEERLRIVHVSANGTELCVLVQSSESHAAMALIHGLCKYARPVAA